MYKIKLLTKILAASLLLPFSLAKKKDKPNIVVMFADNLGYYDVSAFSDDPIFTSTPNIDRLAQEGTKFHHWNSGAVMCSPSRSALLTGKLPIRNGIYPVAFSEKAEYGLPLNETTIADYLKEEGYATSIVGKWHLGHSKKHYLPTKRGFDEWTGLPFHMAGGSIEEHICGVDVNETLWMPLYKNTKIVQQPVRIQNLAQVYAKAATDFIDKSVNEKKPFFLYMAFSHVHQLCAPRFSSEQGTCQWASTMFSSLSPVATFNESVLEMDWIAGEILKQIEKSGLVDNTLVIFTSDNGPYISEQSCSGKKGPFQGVWYGHKTAKQL